MTPSVEVVVTRNAALDRDTLLHVVELVKGGGKVTEIAFAFELRPKIIYYWLKKFGVDVKATGRVLREQEQAERAEALRVLKAESGAGRAPRTYYSYVQESYRKGRISKRQRDTGLARFYRYRNEHGYSHETSVSLVNMTISHD